MPRLFLWTLAVLFAATLALSACGADTIEDGDEPLVIYAGRKDVLVDPLVERFESESGIEVEVRYGTDAALIAALQEEGEASPADLFWANTAGALGAATEAGLLTTLPDSILAMPSAFVPSGGRWVPVTTRFRTLAINPRTVDSVALPSSVMDLPQMESLRGRIGWTPAYSSFQDFITAMRQVEGEEATRAWIRGMKALEPTAYESNTPMLEALLAGEIDAGLTNHYYVYRQLYGDAGNRPVPGASESTLALAPFAEGDPGNLALVTGAGRLTTSLRDADAMRFLSFLLSPGAQRFAAESVREYPVRDGVVLPEYFLPFERTQALGPDLNFEQLRNLEGTLALLRDEGLL